MKEDLTKAANSIITMKKYLDRFDKFEIPAIHVINKFRKELASLAVSLDFICKEYLKNESKNVKSRRSRRIRVSHD